jgi:hypothetical protein
MKLVLHIGTPKTGTKALQDALLTHPAELADIGVRYAPYGESDRLASTFLKRENDSTLHDFLDAEARSARREGAETLVASAEAFYAMEHRKLRQGMPEEKLIPAERVMIRRLQAGLSDAIDSVQIVCYFRRPDRYVESSYNQRVKGLNAYTGTAQEFLEEIRPKLRYHAYMECWAEVFGRDNCIARSYDAAEADVVTDFVDHVLGAVGMGSRMAASDRANLRLSRDVVEFKRIVNRRVEGHAYARLEQRIFAALMIEIGQSREPESYQDYFSPSERRRLLTDLGSEMASLCAAYGVPPFPPLPAPAVDSEWVPYPGLAEQRRREIERIYREVRKRPDFKAQRASIRASRFRRRLHRLLVAGRPTAVARKATG